MDTNFLSKTLLFRGITPSEIDSMLGCLRAEEKTYKKDDMIYRAGDQVHTLGLLLSGHVSVENNDFWGNKTILNIVNPGQVFAETYACIPGAELMVNVIALDEVKVLYLDMSNLIKICGNHCNYHTKLIENLLSISAQKNLNLSRRSFHTAPKSIRGRLLSYLSYEASRQGSYAFDIAFNRQQLADYLNVDRSALSNELSKMLRDGLLNFEHNHFVLSKDVIEDYS